MGLLFSCPHLQALMFRFKDSANYEIKMYLWVVVHIYAQQNINEIALEVFGMYNNSLCKINLDGYKLQKIPR